MGRSVSTLRDSVINLYADITHISDSQEFEDLIDNIRYEISARYKNMKRTFEHEGENLIICENGLLEIAISEYCGLLSLSIRAKEGKTKHLGVSTALKMEAYLQKLLKDYTEGVYTKAGTFSNGESVYTKVN